MKCSRLDHLTTAMRHLLDAHKQLSLAHHHLQGHITAEAVVLFQQMQRSILEWIRNTAVEINKPPTTSAVTPPLKRTKPS